MAFINGSYYPDRFQFNYMPHRYAAYAVAALAAMALSTLLPIFIGAPVAILCLVGYIQFVWTATGKYLPWENPLAIKFTDWCERTWWYQTSPARFGSFQNKLVLERWVGGGMDFREIYDLQGNAIGTEQIIDWSYSDPDWQPGDHQEIETIFKECAGKLPRIARWRTGSVDSF